MPDLRNDVSKRKVGRTKIVSPLADAVRLVDHEERYANRLEDVEKALVFELLGVVYRIFTVPPATRRARRLPGPPIASNSGR